MGQSRRSGAHQRHRLGICRLLEATGVDLVLELAQRNANNLHAKLSEITASKEMVRRLPTADQLRAWVEEAKMLPQVSTH
jgi:hypothetical protein